jgi:hypothetical protein
MPKMEQMVAEAAVELGTPPRQVFGMEETGVLGHFGVKHQTVQ